MSEHEDYELCVIGAGIVGLATARAFLENGSRSLLVLEAEDRPAAHQTGHNSGVLHSGLYYRPGSLKAKLCAEGREEMALYCTERSLPFERCGKIVVATRNEELAALDELERRGRANGLAGIERLGPEGLRAHEPHVAGIAGLWVPQTGILDYREVARSFARDIEERGGRVCLRRPAGAIRRESEHWLVETPAGRVRVRFLVNCGGLHADRIARRAGHPPLARIVPFRGEYKLVRPERKTLVRNLVYPVPDARFPFLGVHFTRGIDGTLEAGPNAVLALARHGYSWRNVSLGDLVDMASFGGFWRMAARYFRTGTGELVRSLSHRAFTRALQRLLPEIQPEDLLPGGSGVRAQALDPDGKLADDFRFTEGPGALHVLSAPSPAATASLAIGRSIVERANALFGSKA
jgi:L-2-hydroxyglutarate oxidase